MQLLALISRHAHVEYFHAIHKIFYVVSSRFMYWSSQLLLRNFGQSVINLGYAYKITSTRYSTVTLLHIVQEVYCVSETWNVIKWRFYQIVVCSCCTVYLLRYLFRNCRYGNQRPTIFCRIIDTVTQHCITGFRLYLLYCT